MAAKNAFLELDQATASEAWEWLQINAPTYARGVETATRAGATPQEIFYRVLDRVGTHRRALAMRCRLAAEALSSE